jgi:hypothetical protein
VPTAGLAASEALTVTADPPPPVTVATKGEFKVEAAKVKVSTKVTRRRFLTGLCRRAPRRGRFWKPLVSVLKRFLVVGI